MSLEGVALWVEELVVIKSGIRGVIVATIVVVRGKDGKGVVIGRGWGGFRCVIDGRPFGGVFRGDCHWGNKVLVIWCGGAMAVMLDSEGGIDVGVLCHDDVAGIIGGGGHV